MLRMNRLPGGIWAVLAATLGVSPVRAAAPAARAAASARLQRGFQAIYDARNAAFVRKDADKFLSYAADNLTIIGDNGQVTTRSKARYRAQLKQIFAARPTINAATVSSIVRSVRLTRDGAIVVTGSKADSGTDRDFWVNKGGRWQLLRHRRNAGLRKP